MSSRLRMSFGISALLATLLGQHFAYAQSLNCHDTQYPVSATTAQNIKVSIDDVEFSGENALADAARAELLKSMKQLDLKVTQEGNDSDWLGYLEVPVRETFQNQGYFRVVLETTPYLIRAEAHERHYVVKVEIDSGPQFRLDEIRFSGVTDFAQADLREQFSLHHGDLFDVSELRKGMESITKLYISKGFIDMVPEPEETIDEKNLRISVLFKVDEGKQYHVRTVEIRGLDPQAEQAVKSQVGPGQVFDVIAFRKLVEKHMAGLRTDILNDVIQATAMYLTIAWTFSWIFDPAPRRNGVYKLPNS